MIRVGLLWQYAKISYLKFKSTNDDSELFTKKWPS